MLHPTRSASEGRTTVATRHETVRPQPPTRVQHNVAPHHVAPHGVVNQHNRPIHNNNNVHRNTVGPINDGDNNDNNNNKMMSSCDKMIHQHAWLIGGILTTFALIALVLLVLLFATNIIIDHSSSSSTPVLGTTGGGGVGGGVSSSTGGTITTPLVTTSCQLNPSSLCALGGSGSNSNADDQTGGKLAVVPQSNPAFTACVQSKTGLITHKTLGGDYNGLSVAAINQVDLNAYAFTSEDVTNAVNICCQTPGCVNVALSNRVKDFTGYSLFGASGKSSVWPVVLRTSVATAFEDYTDFSTDSVFVSAPVTSTGGSGSFTPTCSQGSMGIVQGSVYQTTANLGTWQYTCSSAPASATSQAINQVMQQCLTTCANSFTANGHACVSITLSTASTSVGYGTGSGDTYATIMSNIGCSSGYLCVIFGSNTQLIPSAGTSQYSQQMLPNVFNAATCSGG